MFVSTADECKKKLKNLKDRMREVCSRLPKTKSGQTAFEKGEATVCWAYYKPMLFMKDQFVGRSMISNVEGDLMSQSVLSDDSMDGSEATRTSTPVSEQSSEASSSRNQKKKAPPKYNRQKLEEEFLAIEREKMDNMKTALQMKPEQPTDEWDKFSASINCDLRKLKDPFIILRVKADIHKEVNNAVLEQLSLDRGQSEIMGGHQMNRPHAASMGYAARMDFPRSCSDTNSVARSSTSDNYEIYQSQYHQV